MNVFFHLDYALKSQNKNQKIVLCSNSQSFYADDFKAFFSYCLTCTMSWKFLKTSRTIINKELSYSIELKDCNNIYLDQNYFSRHLGICNTQCFEL